MLNRRIRKNHHPFNSLQELENALIIEWNAIPQYKIQKIIRGVQEKKEVELPLLPAGPGQDTDIVYFCVNSSLHSLNPEVGELRFFVSSGCSLLLLLFVRTIYLLLCNEI